MIFREDQFLYNWLQPKKPKVEHITEPLRFTFEVATEDLPRLPEATVSEYRAKLEALKERDDAKRLYETALNKLG